APADAAQLRDRTALHAFLACDLDGEGSRVVLAIAVGHGDSLFGAEFVHDFRHPAKRGRTRAYSLDREDLAVVALENGFDVQQAAQKRLRPPDATTPLQIFQRVEGE